ncbi:MAG: hypothetical protein Q9M45_07800 [Robiginitomaculum sp.]|nr:hypothetical protein [Robiginitomaculum sp.]
MVIKDIERASEDMDAEELQFVIYEDIEFIETLLSASFLVIQTYITLVLEKAKALCKNSHESHADYKKRILKKGPSFDENYSKIEILWALANYVKHNEEWTQDIWKNPEAKQEVKAVGLRLGSTGNLRKAAKALGNENFSDTSVFIKIVDDWAKEIYEEASSAST